MPVGIEQFRTLSSKARYIDLAPDNSDKLVGVKAPKRLFGRAVSWSQKAQSSGDMELRDVHQQDARTAFRKALVKAYGKTVAASVLQGSSVLDKSKRAEPLDSKEVKQVLDAADMYKKGYVKENTIGAKNFMLDGMFSESFKKIAGVDLPENSGFPATFFRAVVSHPEYGARLLTNEDLRTIAEETARSYVAAQGERLERSYPVLTSLASELKNPIKATDGFFEELDAAVRHAQDGFLGESVEVRKAALDAIKEIRSASELLAETPFDVAKMREYKTELEAKFDNINERMEALADSPQSKTEDGEKLLTALFFELRTQSRKLENKADFADEYLRHDPLSPQSLTGNGQLWGQAGWSLIQDMMRDVGIEGYDLIGKLNGIANGLLADPKADEEKASADERLDVKEVKSLINKQKADVREAVLKAYDAVLESGEIKDKSTLNMLNARKKNIGGDLKVARLKAMNELQQWKAVERDMVVTRGGETRTYKSAITPASATTGRIARFYKKDGIRGVSAGTKDNAAHARNLQVSTLTDETGRTLSSVVRHGVLDPWKLKSKDQRDRAADSQVDEVMHLAVEETAPRFKQALLAAAAAKLADPSAQVPDFRHVHVNINLTTPVDRGLADFNEGTFTQRQFAAFDRYAGERSYKLDDPDSGTQDVQTPKVQVDTITFSYGVNDLALAAGKNVPAGVMKATAWSNVAEHNAANLQKLIGDLSTNTRPGGLVGEMLDRLDKMPRPQGAAASWDADKARLAGQIREQVEIVRGLVESGMFMERNSDPYKMPRHIMRLVGLTGQAADFMHLDSFALTQSQGCKSNKDRGGMADVEHKAQVVIEDMGGRVLPAEPLDGEDRTIYNTVLTSSGQDEVQSLNTGLPGSKNAHEARARINDEGAVEYAGGLSTHVKA